MKNAALVENTAAEAHESVSDADIRVMMSMIEYLFTEISRIDPSSARHLQEASASLAETFMLPRSRAPTRAFSGKVPPVSAENASKYRIQTRFRSHVIGIRSGPAGTLRLAAIAQHLAGRADMRRRPCHACSAIGVGLLAAVQDPRLAGVCASW